MSANEVYPESEAGASDVQQLPSTTTTPTTSTLLITTTKGLETTPAGTTIDNTEVQTVLAVTPTTAAPTTTTTTATPIMQRPTTESIKFSTTTTARGVGVPEAPVISDNAAIDVPKIAVSMKTTTVTTTTTTSPDLPQTTIAANESDLTTSESSALTSTKHKPNAGARQRAYPRWGNWGKWSDCSRSCGGGVRFQQRKCINRWVLICYYAY